MVLVIGRVLTAVTADYYALFATASAIGNSACLAVYQTPIAIGMYIIVVKLLFAIYKHLDRELKGF